MNPLRWRKMTWLILLFTGLMAAWIIGGIAAQEDCGNELPGSVERELCETGTDIGTGIGVGALFCVWFLGFVVLSIIWFMTRHDRRLCPVCGHDVRKGQLVCKKCGYDFGAAAPVAARGTVTETSWSIGGQQGDTETLEPPGRSQLITGAPDGFCGNCGAWLAGGTRFCPHCGTPVGQT
jgi:hypothetical protein